MVEIRDARPDERADVAAFMLRAFPKAKWGIEGWHLLLSGRWSGAKDRFAVIAIADDQIVGAIGLISSTRITDRGPLPFVNLTSWYVLRPYRGVAGKRLMQAAIAPPGTTFTNITSARAAIPLVRRLGFDVLDDTRMIWHSRDNTPLNHTLNPLSDALLNTVDRQVLKDHADLNLKPVTLETPDGPCTLVLSVKQKVDEYVTHEVVYVGQPALLSRHACAIADTLLPVERAIFSVDNRLISGATPDAVESIDVPRFYQGGDLLPSEVDHMYSEVVLMDMKLY